MAKLLFYYGAMGSGKSLRLLASAHNFEEKKIPFMCLKPSLDTRDGETINSRVGLNRPCVLVEKDTDIYHATYEYFDILNSKGNTLKWILIDEAQFLTKKQVDDLAKIVDELEINVMCFGIRTDFKTELFEGSKRLFEIADEFEEIKSSCRCGRKAMINARFNEYGEMVTEGDSIVIGGNDIYEPLCRKCWRKKLNN